MTQNTNELYVVINTWRNEYVYKSFIRRDAAHDYRDEEAWKVMMQTGMTREDANVHLKIYELKEVI